MTSQNEQQASNLHGHLPECPQITGKPDWYCCEDCDPGVWDDCICDRLRACEQRVRMEDDDYAYVAAQAEADGRWRGWTEALDAAREAVMRTCGHTKYEGCSPCLHDDATAAIDALRDQPADQTGYNLPDAP